MDKTKSKLRLRKSVVISVPIIVVLLIVGSILIINRDKLFAKETEVEKIETAWFNEETSFRLADSEYLKSLNKLIEDRKKDNTIITYAEKYHLNIEKALEIAHNITNNYEDEYFKESNSIAPTAYRNRIGSYDSFEAGAIIFVRDLYIHPERYGTNANEMIISNKVDLVDFTYGKPLYLSNGLTFEQYYGHIADLFGVDKTTALAMAFHESGYPTTGTSGLFLYNNNIGGIKCGTGCWASYPSMEAGIIAHIMTVKSIADGYGLDITTDSGLLAFSGVYVRGNINKPTELWVNRVNYFKNYIDSKDMFKIN